jgi:hypothetical protein
VPYRVLRDRLDTGWEAGLLPIVRERIESEEDPLGVPFCVTLSYLMANRSLEREAGLTARAWPDAFAWLEALVRAAPALRALAAEPLVLTGTFDLFLLTGALSWTETAGPQIDLDAAERLLALIQAGRFPVAHTEHVLGRFCAGTLMHLEHCSFAVPDLLRGAASPWQARPLPIAPGLVRPAWLTVFAISRACADPDLGGRLLRYLTSPDVQARFGREQANLPALAEAAEHVAPTPGGEVTRDTVRAALGYSTLLWPQEEWQTVESTLNRGRKLRDLLCGHASAADALEEVRYAANFLPVRG